MGTILIFVFADFYWKIAFQQNLLKIFKKSLKIHNRILETDDVGNYPKLCL
jgi:hypothetical protein